ncbi:MAG: sn-glycerol-3-phosphate ABC transporter ATP-binding protein UgpC, partial [Oscillospiraceae bacterium]
MATVTLKNLKKMYDEKVTAVHDFSLEIADKEFIVLVGPSGCGKSTTLRMVAGLEDITEGELFIGEKRMNDVEPKDRDIAMVFQNYALYPHMTVFENMAFALKLRKEPKPVIEKKVHEAAEILDITDLLQRKPKELSGGQRQRVAIGRAIVRDPQVFLMDEPLSNLDAKLRNQMRAELIKLRQRINTTFIYVTHDQTEAMTLGDRIVIMKDGEIMQIGTPQEVFDFPTNVFVAGFIGSPQMNMFKAKLNKNGEEYSLSCEGATMPLSENIQKRLAAKNVQPMDVIAGARPEHITFVREPDNKTISGEVDVSEMMGSELHLHVTAGEKDIVLRVPTIDLPTECRAGIPFGAQVHFTFHPDLIHLFDPETQLNL